MDEQKNTETLYKAEYIEFINKLMHRMKMDGIRKMLDLALEQID